MHPFDRPGRVVDDVISKLKPTKRYASENYNDFALVVCAALGPATFDDGDSLFEGTEDRRGTWIVDCEIPALPII